MYSGRIKRAVPSHNQYGRNCTDRSCQRSQPYGVRTVTDGAQPYWAHQQEKETLLRWMVSAMGHNTGIRCSAWLTKKVEKGAANQFRLARCLSMLRLIVSGNILNLGCKLFTFPASHIQAALVFASQYGGCRSNVLEMSRCLYALRSPGPCQREGSDFFGTISIFLYGYDRWTGNPKAIQTLLCLNESRDIFHF
ncbi:hypothetical protein ARMSODRAFT_973583 [Armillaria solidipes]|uniref:Uncharacterized protein n=1 Tax=Armillaria solidipes TaxID=1076256 RepID=A0A2H3BVT9_9AGAR|nr:hypothetical protein ARMSODRAFT_973583 [Armillaria solidipes]